MTRAVLFGCLVLAACGDDGSTTTVDASMIPPTITIGGKVEDYGASGSTPLGGVSIAAYRVTDDATVVASAMSDANGDYALTFDTNGQPLDGYLKATVANHMDTYVYPPGPVEQDTLNARVVMVTPGVFTLVSDTLCGGNQQASNGAIAAIVGDVDQNPLSGATVACSPAAMKYCYNSGGFPNRTATATDTDGISYLLNVPVGRVTVSAMKPGFAFPSHPVTARAGVLTTTLIIP
jgi:hypothetical protein